jgi:hypothetical protein
MLRETTVPLGWLLTMPVAAARAPAGESRRALLDAICEFAGGALS